MSTKDQDKIIAIKAELFDLQVQMSQVKTIAEKRIAELSQVAATKSVELQKLQN